MERLENMIENEILLLPEVSMLYTRLSLLIAAVGREDQERSTTLSESAMQRQHLSTRT